MHHRSPPIGAATRVLFAVAILVSLGCFLVVKDLARVFADLYGAFGAEHPRISLYAMTSLGLFIGGVLSFGFWKVAAHEYRMDPLSKTTSTPEQWNEGSALRKQARREVREERAEWASLYSTYAVFGITRTNIVAPVYDPDRAGMVIKWDRGYVSLTQSDITLRLPDIELPSGAGIINCHMKLPRAVGARAAIALDSASDIKVEQTDIIGGVGALRAAISAGPSPKTLIVAELISDEKEGVVLVLGLKPYDLESK
jgi:hypothetical protein